MKWKVTQSQREDLKEFGTSDNRLCWRNGEWKTWHKGSGPSLHNRINYKMSPAKVGHNGKKDLPVSFTPFWQLCSNWKWRQKLTLRWWTASPSRVEAGHKFTNRSWKCQLRKLMSLQNQNNFERLSLMFLEDLQKCKLNVNLTSLLQLFLILKFSLI